MATKSLGLPPDARAKVFRAIVTHLKNDPILKRVVGQSWYVWDGGKNDEQDFGSGEGVPIRLTPMVGLGDWLDETGQSFPLIITIEALIPGTDVDDVMALQGAIENALYMPSNLTAAQAFRNLLTSQGAVDGLISFLPLNDPDAVNRKDGVWGLRGQLKIDVRRTFNP